MSDDSDLATSAQDCWTEIAQAIRIRLLQMAKELPMTTLHGIRDYTQLCRDTLQFETWAATFDHDVEAILARPHYDHD